VKFVKCLSVSILNRRNSDSVTHYCSWSSCDWKKRLSSQNFMHVERMDMCVCLCASVNINTTKENREFAVEATNNFRTRNWNISWIRWIRFVSSHNISFRSICMSCLHLNRGVQIGLFSSDIPTKIIYLFLITPLNDGNRDSSVGIATGCGLDDQRARDRVPVGSKIFTLHIVQTGSGVHPTSYKIGTGGSFPVVKR
jgi:hypothetical protein